MTNSWLQYERSQTVVRTFDDCLRSFERYFTAYLTPCAQTTDPCTTDLWRLCAGEHGEHCRTVCGDAAAPLAAERELVQVGRVTTGQHQTVVEASHVRHGRQVADGRLRQRAEVPQRQPRTAATHLKGGREGRHRAVTHCHWRIYCHWLPPAADVVQLNIYIPTPVRGGTGGECDHSLYFLRSDWIGCVYHHELFGTTLP